MDLPTCWHQGLGPLSTQLNHSHWSNTGFKSPVSGTTQTTGFSSSPWNKQNKPDLLPFHSLSPQTFAALQDVPELELGVSAMARKLMAAAALKKSASPPPLCHAMEHKQSFLKITWRPMEKGGEKALCGTELWKTKSSSPFLCFPGNAPCLPCHSFHKPHWPYCFYGMEVGSILRRKHLFFNKRRK